MIKKNSLVVFFFAIVFLVGCQGINLDVPEGNNFNPVSNATYAWSWPPLENLSSSDESAFLLDSALRVELNQQLAEKGYRLSKKDEPDFMVGYSFFKQMIPDQNVTPERVILANKRWLDSVSFDDGSGSNSLSTIRNERASLRVYFMDQSGKTIWEVVASKVVEQQFAGREQYDAVVKRAVKRMMMNLPEKG
ncbi:MAG: DUF4136 domain-containing protein [Spongiibacteraceae bacterium]|nr:DUF4136 domain-containing protein [Spongiibacteraceae bacterium]